MKLKRSFIALFCTTTTLLLNPAFARTIVEVGTEYEQYFDQTDKGASYNYERLSAYTPYARFYHTPLNNQWNVWGRAFKKIYPNDNLYTDSKTTSQTGRLELHYTKTIRNGDWRFRPGAGVRYNSYDIDRYEFEYRLYPQVDYFFNNKSQAFFSGHWYMGNSKGKRQSDDSAKNYTDWGYEAEFGWLYRLGNGSSIKPHFFTEYDSFENNYDVKYWQFRLTYTVKVGRATISPFIRYGLGREVTDRSHTDPERWGLSRDNNYSRAGVYGNVGISGKWNMVYETYYQIEDQHGTYGEALPDRNKVFAKIGIQRVF